MNGTGLCAKIPNSEIWVIRLVSCWLSCFFKKQRLDYTSNNIPITAKRLLSKRYIENYWYSIKNFQEIEKQANTLGSFKKYRDTNSSKLKNIFECLPIKPFARF